MILSGHQPVYLPGIRLFNKIALSDAFMFVGHCQYSPKSWQTRNYIRTGMLSVPVHKDLGQSINRTKIVEEAPWIRKHLGSIRGAYSHYPYFTGYFPGIERILETSCSSLACLDIRFMREILRWLDIKTPVVDSRQYVIAGDKTDMLISMCKAVGADEYLSNEGSRDYIGPAEEQQMLEAGIKHRWQKFTDPDYGQDKTHNGGRLSVIDLLFSKGPEAGAIIRSVGYVG